MKRNEAAAKKAAIRNRKMKGRKKGGNKKLAENNLRRDRKRTGQKQMAKTRLTKDYKNGMASKGQKKGRYKQLNANMIRYAQNLYAADKGQINRSHSDVFRYSRGKSRRTDPYAAKFVAKMNSILHIFISKTPKSNVINVPLTVTG